MHKDYKTEKYLENLRRISEKTLMRSAQKELLIDANLKMELQKNIEEEKLIEKMNKVSQNLYNSYLSRPPVKKPSPKDPVSLNSDIEIK